MSLINVTQTGDGYSMDTLFEQLEYIAKSMVVKYTNIAKQSETKESRMNGDKYIACKNGQTTIYAYDSFDEDVYIRAGLTPSEIAQIDTVYDIPPNKVNTVIKIAEQDFVEEYEELNEYYRAYAGLPPLDDIEQIFAPEEFYWDLGIIMVPVYKLSDYHIQLLQNRGILADIQEENPDKVYLHYLGSRRIDPMIMRSANNFELVFLDKSTIDEFIYEEYTKIYETQRSYYISCIYNKDIQAYTPGYDNFFGLTIGMSTILKMMVNTMKYTIERSFYDLKAIKMLYDSYNVPYVEKLPMSYHQALARNLNYLLQHKSTEKVMEDLFKTFNTDNITVYRYYLIKQHKMENNEPLFLYKYDDHGEPILDENGKKVLDPEKMYDFYFQMVDLGNRNYHKAFNDMTLRESYETITKEDRYWVEDDALKQKLIDMNANFIETKYLGLVVMNKLSEVIFECQYCLNMIIDKKEEVQDIKVKMYKLFGNVEIDLFSLVSFLCALVCKKQGFAGNILYKSTQIAKVLGFNMKADMEDIRTRLLEDDLCDPSLKEYLLEMDINNASDVNKLFKEIKGFHDTVMDKLFYAKTLEEYYLYYEIYKTLLVTEQNEESFKLDDGTQCITFLEYLQNTNILLSDFVEEVQEDEMPEAIDIAINALHETVPALQYIFSLNDNNQALIDAILQLVMFFKSYTTDIAHVSINYIFKNPPMNSIKFVDSVKIENYYYAKDDFFDMSYDMLKIDSEMKIPDRLNIRESLYVKHDDDDKIIKL